MALTVTRSGDWQSVYGHWRKTHVTIAFDTFYNSGGESLAPSDFGLRVVDMILVEPKNGYMFEYDYSNSLLKVFKSQSSAVIHVDTSNTENVGGGEDSLHSTTLAAGTLSQNGMAIRVTGWGTTASNATSKELRGYYGDSSTGVAFLQTSQAGNWRAVFEIVRTGAAASDTNFLCIGGSTASTPLGFGANTVTTTSTITETHATSKTVRFSGKAGATSDIIQSGMIVEQLVPQANAGSVGIEVPHGADLSSLTSVRVIAWGY